MFLTAMHDTLRHLAHRNAILIINTRTNDGSILLFATVLYTYCTRRPRFHTLYSPAIEVVWAPSTLEGVLSNPVVNAGR